MRISGSELYRDRRAHLECRNCGVVATIHADADVMMRKDVPEGVLAEHLGRKAEAYGWSAPDRCGPCTALGLLRGRLQASADELMRISTQVRSEGDPAASSWLERTAQELPWAHEVVPKSFRPDFDVVRTPPGVMAEAIDKIAKIFSFVMTDPKAELRFGRTEESVFVDDEVRIRRSPSTRHAIVDLRDDEVRVVLREVAERVIANRGGARL